jgi:hypothetical protein
MQPNFRWFCLEITKKDELFKGSIPSSVYKICGFANSGLAHVINLRICDWLINNNKKLRICDL